MKANPLEGRTINPWFDPNKAKAEQHEHADQAGADACVLTAARAKRARRMAKAAAGRRGSSLDPGLQGSPVARCLSVKQPETKVEQK